MGKKLLLFVYKLQFDYKYGHRRMIRPVVIFCFNNQKFPGIQHFQPFQQCIPFLKPGISAAVDTQHQDPALFQKGQGYGKCLNTGFCSRGKSMIAFRQIAEIEYNAAYTHRLCVFPPYLRGNPETVHNCGEHFPFPAALWYWQVPFPECRKGEYMSFFPHKDGKKQSVISVSHGGINAKVSFFLHALR